MKEWKFNLFKSILAGCCISLASIVYLSIESKLLGSLFFTVGLYLILINNLNLFTGKLCYVEFNDHYIWQTLITWIGNFIGAIISFILIILTPLRELDIKNFEVMQHKIQIGESETYTVFGILILGILCEFMIAMAVLGFKNEQSNLSKFISLFFGVSIFVYCGFEHCVADMFYFIFSLKHSISDLNIFFDGLSVVMAATIGNIIGGVIIKYIKDLLETKV